MPLPGPAEIPFRHGMHRPSTVKAHNTRPAKSGKSALRLTATAAGTSRASGSAASHRGPYKSAVANHQRSPSARRKIQSPRTDTASAHEATNVQRASRARDGDGLSSGARPSMFKSAGRGAPHPRQFVRSFNRGFDVEQFGQSQNSAGVPGLTISSPSILTSLISRWRSITTRSGILTTAGWAVPGPGLSLIFPGRTLIIRKSER
jgi:hypothetical protein